VLSVLAVTGTKKRTGNNMSPRRVPGTVFSVFFAFIGISMEHVVLYKGIFHTNVMIHHSNIAIRESFDKLLRLVIVSPNMHRVHHSIKREETDSNFFSVLTRQADR